jgi:hypothetical protein
MRDMQKCEQTSGQSVLDHGMSVRNYLFDIINHLENGTPLKYKWVLPDWVLENKKIILSSLPDRKVLKIYTTLHDCGKPYCIEYDTNGKRHFPNHAEVSANIFSSIIDNKESENLIRQDMDIHLLKSDGVEEFCKNPNAITLLITGLSEIHSNSQMFGGIESVNFKIKWKCINKRGKQIIKIIKNGNKQLD